MRAKGPLLPLLAGLALAVPSLFTPGILWEWRNHSAAQNVALSGMPYLDLSRGLLLMHPLILHASSPAETPGRRRVVHLEYAAGPLPGGVDWFEWEVPGP